MTISTDDNEVSYTGNGVTTVFSFSRLFYDEDHVQVYLDNVLQTSGYTVSGVGTTGGNVTFTSAPGTDVVVLIRRVVPYRQETDFENNDGNPSDVTEKQFDLVVMQTQQLNEGLGRAITVPIGDTATNLELPSVASRAGGVLYFDGSGNVTITTDSDSASAAAAAASASAASSSASAAAASAVTAEAAAVGIKWRPQVKAATTANITLSGAQTLDGISCISGDRVLAKDQLITADNGIYIVAPGSWTRASDADTWDELVSLAVSVEQGATLADTQWICTSNSGGTLGITAVTFAGFLTTPRDSSVTYTKVDPNAVATTANVVSGTASKLVSAAGLAPLYYGCSVYQTAAQSIPNNTWTTIAFDTEDYDDATWHDNVTNNSRITVNFTGRVAVSAIGATAAGGGSSCGVQILKNGSAVAADRSTEPVNGVTMDLTCASSDYFEVQVIQSSGASQNTQTGVSGCRFAVRRIK